MTDVQTWIVKEWGRIEGGILGAVIVCPVCEGKGKMHYLADPCSMCDGDGELHQPYQLPNGAFLDLERDAEILIEIEPREDEPSGP